MKQTGIYASKLRVVLIIIIQALALNAMASAEVNYAGPYEMSNWIESIFGSAGVWIVAIIAAVIVWFVLDKKNNK